ncbi:CapA family protein [Aeromicrobium sp. CF4.19]|uniref:CapA family protein n=1 Tax=Aeromicrobium sp. CF4.19 TaxID=3373082 RepID=UPI003EE695A1
MNDRGSRRSILRSARLLLGATAVVSACTVVDGRDEDAEDERAADTVTLALAGDVHFAAQLAETPREEDSTLGSLSRRLAQADLAILNLESSVTTRRGRADKELEDPDARFWFRTPAAALDVLARSGVDVVSMANNHGADYGVAGVRDSVAAGEDSDVSLVGIGLDDEEAFAPVRRTVRDTSVAVHAADASPLESEDDTWNATPGSGPGIAAARGESRERLVEEVRQSAEVDDVVVVYLHWGTEGSSQPTGDQQSLAAELAEAGADVVAGAHAHVPLGAGTVDDTYVSYGLGNFFWYHGDNAETGVLELTVRDGTVVQDAWVPGTIPPEGGPASILRGGDADEAVESWRGLRGRTDLAAGPGEDPQQPPAEMPDFSAAVREIDAATRERMTSHEEGTCPVSWADLRRLEVDHVGFDGSAHEGELVVHEDVAEEVAGIFESLYEARFPIQSMRLVDEFGGDDDRVMAANNSSAYNCRRVAGSSAWSAHAYGRAVDINPVQNPYVVDGTARPPAAQSYVDVDRSAGARAEAGVIVADDVVADAFASVGWEWGADFEEPDFQHFADADPRRP